jgi:hypothetical protein
VQAALNETGRVMQEVEALGAMRWLASLFKVRSFPDPSIEFPVRSKEFPVRPPKIPCSFA